MRGNRERREFTVSMLPLETVHETSSQEKDPKLLLNLHRRIPMLPFFKRNVTVEDLMSWNPAPLNESLCLAAKKSKDLVKTVDKTITEIVKKDSEPEGAPYVAINELLHIGIFEGNGSMTDEIYLQIMRRINGNELDCLWKLMICVTATFPPSKALWPFVSKWMANPTFLNNSFAVKAIKRCKCNLYVFKISGPRGYSTSIEDVQYWYDESHEKLPLFGIELSDIYEDPALLEECDGVQIPKVVKRLVDMIIMLNGFEKEGIFRVSGDLQLVFQLKILLSRDSDMIDMRSFKDASVPCSALKLWMRVLRSPLIPDNLYSQILVARNNSKKLAEILEYELPKPNYAVISFICNFLIELAQPQHQELTKMTLDNFSMIFAPCFMRCPLTASAVEVLRRSGEERQVLKEIFNHFISVKR